MVRLKYILGDIALVLGSVLVALLLAEIGLRVLGISEPVFDTYDPVRGLALRPGKEGWYRKEGEAYLRINPEGYRDVEHSVAKPEGVYRIAMLGDSFTEARQVDIEQTYWRQMADSLRGCPGLRGRSIEIFNFAIGGYETTHALLTLEKDVLKYRPDAVLLGFFAGNDVEGNSRELSYNAIWRADKPFYVMRNGQLQLYETLHVPLSRRLLYESVHYSRIIELFNAVRRDFWVYDMQRDAALTRPEGIEIGTSEKVYKPPENAAWRGAWDITERLLARIQARVADHGGRFAVLTIPTAIQVHPDSTYRDRFEQALGSADLFYPDHALSQMGQRHGFDVFELTPQLQAANSGTGRFMHGFPNTVLGEGHLNEYGHDLVSQVLAPRVCDWIGRGQ